MISVNTCLHPAHTRTQTLGEWDGLNPSLGLRLAVDCKHQSQYQVVHKTEQFQ